MNLSPSKKVVLIFLLTFIAGIVSLPKQIPINFVLGHLKINKTFVRPDINISLGRFRIEKKPDLSLGLDLAGGSHLVFEADTSSLPPDKKGTAINALRSIIEKRVNLFGISEPNVQTSSFEGKDRIIVELPGVKDTKEAIGVVGKTAQLRFAELSEEEGKGLIQTDLTGAFLKEAEVVFDKKTGKPSISIEFTSEGAKKFETITERNIGKPLAILLDDEVISTPIVQEKITGGMAQITGDFSLDEAKNLVVQLNAGALPVPVKLVEQRTVGATLGAESVRRSINAGLIGLGMVLVFMVVSYGKLGFFADVALIIFGILTLALYKILGVVLTLPGIAGFLLSVGMAVDSNILIFERFKEEKKRRDFANALEVSFGRAWDSIRDANIATLVTAFVLANPLDFSFLQTSGPVRGFAITLILGIVISLFTGIVVTRNLLRVFIKEKSKKK